MIKNNPLARRLRAESFELKAEVDAYMQDKEFLKSCVGIYTIGEETGVMPSATNPLVIVLEIATTDIPSVTKEIYDTLCTPCATLFRRTTTAF